MPCSLQHHFDAVPFHEDKENRTPRPLGPIQVTKEEKGRAAFGCPAVEVAVILCLTAVPFTFRCPEKSLSHALRRMSFVDAGLAFTPDYGGLGPPFCGLAAPHQNT